MMTSQPDSPYAAIFRQYIQRSAQATLDAVQKTGPALPPEQQEQGLHTLDFALNLPDAWREARALLLALAPKVEQAGLRRGWLPFLQRGIERCQAAGDSASQAEMEIHLGMLYFVMGRMDEARALFQASAGRCQALGDAAGQARALNRWAYLDRIQQRSQSAAQLVQQALDLLAPDDAERSFSHYVLGGLAIDRRDWPQALSHLNAALDGWQSRSDPVMVARSLTNLGMAQRGAGQYEEAIASYTEAIAIMAEMGDPVNEAVTRMNLGNVYWATGQPQTALEHYLLAEPIFRRTDDQLRLARVNTTMGIVCTHLGRWEQAHAALATAIDLNRMVGDPRSIANALDALGELYLAQRQPAAALAVLEQALEELAGLRDQPDFAARFSDIYGDILQHLEKARRGDGAQAGPHPVAPV